MFLLGDQPFITPKIINKMIEFYEKGKFEVIMLKTGEKKTPPIIFSRSCFKHIYMLEGDKGAREIIGALKTCYLDNSNTDAIIDIDTFDEYRKINNAHRHK